MGPFATAQSPLLCFIALVLKCIHEEANSTLRSKQLFRIRKFTFTSRI